MEVVLKKENFSNIVDTLSRFHEGKVFIVNLFHGVKNNLIDWAALMDVMDNQKTIQYKHPKSLLGDINKLLKTSNVLYKKHAREHALANESDLSKQAITVMTSGDCRNYYLTKEDDTKYFLAESLGVVANEGDFIEIRKFRSEAATNDGYWTSPTTTKCCWALDDFKVGKADYWRDVLGLVHLDLNEELWAMHYTYKSLPCFKPTAVEANGNARFRQCVEESSTFGKAVDLSCIGQAKDISETESRKELYCNTVKLSSMEEVSFFYLGKTQYKRTSKEENNQYLLLLLAGFTFDAVKDYLITQVA